MIDTDVIEGRASRASAGPWEWELRGGGVTWTLFGGPFVHDGMPCHPMNLFSVPASDFDMAGAQNRDFIAHARVDVPALCAEVRRLRAALAEAVAGWEASYYLGGGEDPKSDRARIDALRRMAGT